MRYRPSLVAGDYVAVHVTEKAAYGSDSFWRRLTASDHGAIAVAENAVERVHPVPRRAVSERVSAGGIGRYHASQRTKSSARRIDREAQPLSLCGHVECRPENARLRPNRAISLVDPAEVIDAREIDHYPAADRATGHAASRSTRNQTCPGLSRPFHQGDYILRIDRNCDGCWNRPSDTRGLGVDRASKLVFAEVTAKARQTIRV